MSSAGFGFVVARFGLFLRQTTAAAAVPNQGRFTEGIGVLLILLGPVLVIVAAWRFFQTEREIAAGVYPKRYGLMWAMIVTSVLLGLVLVGYLLLSGR